MLKKVYIVFFLCSLLFNLHACTSKSAYISLQKHQEIMCNKVPESDYESCMKEANESYEDYQHKREEIIKN